MERKISNKIWWGILLVGLFQIRLASLCAQPPLPEQSMLSSSVAVSGGWEELDIWKTIERNATYPRVNRGTNGHYYAVVQLDPTTLGVYKNTGDPGVPALPSPWEWVLCISSNFNVNGADIEVLCSENSCHVVYVENYNTVRDFRFSLDAPILNQDRIVFGPDTSLVMDSCSLTSSEMDTSWADTTMLFTCFKMRDVFTGYNSVQYCRSVNNGDSWESGIQVNVGNFCDLPWGNAIAFCPSNGRVLFTYSDNSGNIRVYRSAPLGVDPWTPSTLLTSNPSYDYYSGGITCSYQGYTLVTAYGIIPPATNWDVVYKYSLNGGSFWIVATKKFLWPGDQRWPSCASNSSGYFNILYHNTQKAWTVTNNPGMESMRVHHSGLNNTAAWSVGPVDKVTHTNYGAPNACLGHTISTGFRHGGAYQADSSSSHCSYFGWAEHKGYLTVAPCSLAFSWAQGNPAPAPQAFVLTNIGDDSLCWITSATASWLQVSPVSGGPMNHNQTDTVMISIIEPWPGVGTYSDFLIIRDAEEQINLDSVQVVLYALPVPTPDVSLDLTPLAPPVMVPASGGSFDYYATLTNNETSAQTFDAWIRVQKPNGTWTQVGVPIPVTLPGGASVTKLRSQYVPPGAPPGAYSFHAYIGEYPDVIWDSDSFPFWKLPISPGGTELWVARYDSPGNGSGCANAIAVDAAGNVYVTGYSPGSGTGWDYCTVKYNSAGIEQWAARYNGPGNSADAATALVLDANGNVYVTGYSTGSGTSWDYCTIKYDAETGAPLWPTPARYNGSGGNNDKANAIAIDAAGNVYVTGESWGSGTEYDYCTIKYDGETGAPLWPTPARYNGPGNSFDEANSIAVDAEGNVYVTGGSWGSLWAYDYCTIKYDGETGATLWSSPARYNGPANDVDIATSLALDTDGNVCVTGRSMGSGTGFDYCTLKYQGETGAPVWTLPARYSGPGGYDDFAWSVAVDAQNNVYVTGYGNGDEDATDYCTIKYNAAGVQQWLNLYDGPQHGDDEAVALVVDLDGNVYVTGKSMGQNYDYCTIKYSTTGGEEWVARYDGLAEYGEDAATSITVDLNGYVYVTGRSENGSGPFDYCTIKYVSGDLADWEPVATPILEFLLPQEFQLEQNFPNPFNPSTVLSYNLQAASYVNLSVYDVSGRLVSPLVNGWREAGEHQATFDGSKLASGVYLYSLTAGHHHATGKMVLLK